MGPDKGYDRGGNYAFLRFKANSSPMSNEAESGAKGRERSNIASAVDNDKLALDFEIHDLPSFVDQVTLDGKLPPTNEVVNKLQEILTNLQKVCDVQLMNDGDVKQFFTNAIMAVRHLY